MEVPPLVNTCEDPAYLRYVDHLYFSLRRDSEEIFGICQETGDLEQTERLIDLYEDCLGQLSDLHEQLNIEPAENSINCATGECEAVNLNNALFAHENVPGDDSFVNPQVRFIPRGYNVNAPCFVPSLDQGPQNPSMPPVVCPPNPNSWYWSRDCEAPHNQQYPAHVHFSYAPQAMIVANNHITSYPGLVLPYGTGNEANNVPLQSAYIPQFCNTTQQATWAMYAPQNQEGLEYPPSYPKTDQATNFAKNNVKKCRKSSKRKNRNNPIEHEESIDDALGISCKDNNSQIVSFKTEKVLEPPSVEVGVVPAEGLLVSSWQPSGLATPNANCCLMQTVNDINENLATASEFNNLDDASQCVPATSVSTHSPRDNCFIDNNEPACAVPLVITSKDNSVFTNEAVGQLTETKTRINPFIEKSSEFKNDLHRSLPLSNDQAKSQQFEAQKTNYSSEVFMAPKHLVQPPTQEVSCPHKSTQSIKASSGNESPKISCKSQPDQPDVSSKPQRPSVINQDEDENDEHQIIPMLPMTYSEASRRNKPRPTQHLVQGLTCKATEVRPQPKPVCSTSFYKANFTSGPVQAMVPKMDVPSGIVGAVASKGNVLPRPVWAVASKAKVQPVASKVNVPTGPIQAVVAKANVPTGSIQAVTPKANVPTGPIQAVAPKANVTSGSIKTVASKANVTSGSEILPFYPTTKSEKHTSHEQDDKWNFQSKKKPYDDFKPSNRRYHQKQPQTVARASLTEAAMSLPESKMRNQQKDEASSTIQKVEIHETRLEIAEQSESPSIPNVDDAKDMLNEFLKYLNSSSWTTQMTEIDDFESMIAQNDPDDPVLMHPSVSLEQFQEFIVRYPTEAQAFRHAIKNKLKKATDSEIKLQIAHEKRQQLLQNKMAKVRELDQKVEDIKTAQNKLAMDRKHMIDEKLRKAEENRKNYLSSIRRKAHEEEEKLKEIAFINELEAQNRRHDSLALRQEHEERLQYIIDERQRKVEEKAAKEAAVEERRRVLEAERQEKLMKMAEKRRMKEETIDRMQQEREAQRLETAREKAREREERLLARQEAQMANAKELHRRIEQKQKDSARRHEENIELIRQRALEKGLHRLAEETTLCGGTSRLEEPVDSEFPADTNREKIRAMKKKKCRKLRGRMISRASQFLEGYPVENLTNFSFGSLLTKIRRELEANNYSALAPLLSNLRHLLDDHSFSLTNSFRDLLKCRGFGTLSCILKNIQTGNMVDGNHHTALITQEIINIYKISLVSGHNWHIFVMSNDMTTVIDCFRVCITQVKSSENIWTHILIQILICLKETLRCVFEKEVDALINLANLRSQMADVISYMINSGLVDSMVALLQDAVINENCAQIILIPPCIAFFAAMLKTSFRSDELMNTIVSTDCFGTIPLLYGNLQKIGTAVHLPVYVIEIIDFLLNFAELDMAHFQATLGADGMALQFRGIISNLMTFCKKHTKDDLMQAIILLVGFFALGNVTNQTLLQSGQQPTVLHQLLTLPFIYFCDENYMNSLFPTLYVCSYNNPTNKAIVENDLNFSQLEDYVRSDQGRNHELIKLLNKIIAA